MPRPASPITWPEQARFGILAALVVACLLGGGASRLDVLSLVYLQPFAVICLAALLLIPGPIDWRLVRVPLLLLGALAAIMAAQLIPLPPGLWAALPGHGPFAEIARAAGAGEAWRPISLTPDLTLASLAGLVVPAAALVGFASIPRTRTYQLLPILLAGVLMGVLIGLAQVSGGERSPFYQYAVTSPGLPVGLFANRNHQAVLLVAAWPMLAVWAAQATDNRRADNVRRSVAAGMAVLLLPLLVITGSRLGLAMAPIGLLVAALIWRGHASHGMMIEARNRKLLTVAGAIGAALVLIAALGFSRDEGIRRFLETSFAEEPRFHYLPVLLRMLGDFFPVGSGFGSFDPVYRHYEPDALLDATYLNHAHNDLIELGITGGLPAILVGLLFLVWIGRATLAALRDRVASRHRAFAWMAACLVLVNLLSSVVDYPLRTPLMSLLFALACGWLSQAFSASSRGRRAA